MNNRKSLIKQISPFVGLMFLLVCFLFGRGYTQTEVESKVMMYNSVIHLFEKNKSNSLHCDEYILCALLPMLLCVPFLFWSFYDKL